MVCRISNALLPPTPLDPSCPERAGFNFESQRVGPLWVQSESQINRRSDHLSRSIIVRFGQSLNPSRENPHELPRRSKKIVIMQPLHSGFCRHTPKGKIRADALAKLCECQPRLRGATRRIASLPNRWLVHIFGNFENVDKILSGLSRRLPRIERRRINWMHFPSFVLPDCRTNRQPKVTLLSCRNLKSC